MGITAGSDDRSGPAPVTAADPAELRAAPRHTLLIRAAKLIVDGAEYICVLRDASETGVSLRLFHELAPGAGMVLELQNEERHEVESVWQDGDRMGLRFRERVDVHQLIEMPAPFDRRPIRVRLAVPGRIGLGDDAAACTICDLSQLGAKVACARSFAIDQRVLLAAAGMPTVQAKVRWRKAEHLGLAFETTFQLGELANIVEGFHKSAPAPAATPEPI